jgi:orotate phosphoribosyltransferase
MQPMPRLPTPKLLYVHDNLTPFVKTRFGKNSLEYETAQLFIKHIAVQPHTKVGTLEDELAGLISESNPEPFDITFGLGHKGEEIAQLLHGRWSAFPNILRLNITRIEKENGSEHILVSKTDESIEDQIAKADGFDSIALIDDVLFTGFTMRSVMESLPIEGKDCHLFFTRGIEETKKEFEKMGCKVHFGVSLPGKIEVDSSTISIMNLITEGAIRTPSGDLSYCDRGEWMEAWFPNKADTIKHLCQALTTLFANVSQEEKMIKPHVLAKVSK